MITLLDLLAGFLLDLLIGDPHFLYHPVRLVGALISFLEKVIRKIFPKTEKGELAGGTLMAVLVMAVTTAVPALLLYFAGLWCVQARFVVEMILCYWLLATKSLKDESMKVYDKLAAGDLEGSRYAVSMIVGRDTAVLDEKGVTKAAVETVAENTSDGIIAPMLFMAIGGAVFGWFYKSINTMDSMVGYKNDKYLYFGRFAAKLDDVVNFIPARLSGILMVLASGFIGLDRANAWKIFKRDRKNHASPNSAQTEAVMAGALRVQLAGDAWYFGKLYKKPTIGDDLRPVEYEDIKRANQLLYATALLSLLVFSLVKFLVLWA